MAGLDQSLLNQPFDFDSMDLPDFSNRDEPLSVFEDQSIFMSSTIDNFLVGDAASMMQAATLEPSINQTEEDFAANIDPALLPTSDAFLDTFTQLPPLEVTEASFFDPSTGVEWRPMETIKTSIDPTPLNPFDIHLDPFAVQGPLFSNDFSFAPRSTDPSANTVAFPPEVSHSFTEPLDHPTTDRRSAKKSSTTPRHPATRPTKNWTRTGQPRVNGSGCPCTICKGVPVSLAAIRGEGEQASTDAKVKKASTKDTVKKPSKSNKATKTGRITKSKPKKVFPQRGRKASESLFLGSDSDPEYTPKPTARTRRAAALKRGRKMKLSKNVPKELDIDMEGW
ncbi:MAG: hypothetical protein Q9216_001981 [Gyalolechia sp. 2 TL-2023]